MKICIIEEFVVRLSILILSLQTHPKTNKKEKTVKHITGKVIFYAMAFVDSGALAGAALLSGTDENLHNR